MSTIGVDKVILGSDYPFPLGEHHPGKLIESILDWDQEDKVCMVASVYVCALIIEWSTAKTAWNECYGVSGS